MDRTEKLLSLFDSTGFGLEVGPSFRPLLPKSKGYNVETVDFADADHLRTMYKDQEISNIEELNYVSDGSSLLKVIGKPAHYDYIFASHVIEHVTDIITFICDCETLLKPNGLLVLVVPDKRFCFDILRPLSTVGQALQAFHEKRTRHTPGIVFDHINSIVGQDGKIVWLRPNLDELSFIFDLQAAKNAYEKHLTNDEYVDCHGWQFTPEYFRYFVKTLRTLGFIQSGEVHFSINPKDQVNLHEFYIVLSKDAPICATPDMEMLKKTEFELVEMFVHYDGMTSDMPASNALVENGRLKQELAESKREIKALKASTSWKITAPLRNIRTSLGSKLFNS